MFAWIRRVFGAGMHTTPPPLEAYTEGTSPEEVYLDAARHFLDVQIDTGDVLDTKASHTLTVGSVVLPLTGAFLNLGNAKIPDIAESLLVLALVFYLRLLACAARASLLRGLKYRPSITTLREHSEHYGSNSLKRWAADEYEASCRTNAGVLIRKARWVGAATVALIIAVLSLSAAGLAALLL